LPFTEEFSSSIVGAPSLVKCLVAFKTFDLNLGFDAIRSLVGEANFEFDCYFANYLTYPRPIHFSRSQWFREREK
jgi:hypothetical protein